MAEWSDWYAREDPTTWVLAEVLKRRAAEHPGPRLPEVRRRALGELRRGQRARQPGRQRPDRPRACSPGESVSVMLPNCEEFIPVWFGILKAGAVMSSINTAYKGDFLSWTINLVESKKLVISDEYLDRLDLIKDELPLLEHVIVLETGPREGPDPALAWEPLDGAAGRPPTPSPTGSTYSWTDDARIMFTSGTTGRSKGVIKQNAADYFSARGLLEVVSATAGKSVESLAEDTFFSCLPLFHSNAQVLSGYPALVAGGAGRLRGALLLEPLLAAGRSTPRRRSSTRSARSATSSGTSRPRTSTGPTRSTPASPPRRPRTSTTSSRSASGSSSSRATASPRPAWPPTWTRPSRGVPGSMGKANPGYEVTIVEPGTDRPLPPDTPGRDRGRHEDPEHRHARLLRHAGEDRRGLPQPEAPHRRPGAHGRRRLLLLHGPGEGLHPPPRRERLLDGGREPGRRDHPERQGGRGHRGEGRRGRLERGRDHDRLHRRGGRAGPGRAAPTGWPSGCRTSWCPRYIRFVEALPKTPTERVQKVKLREEGITPDTFDREAAGITIKR